MPSTEAGNPALQKAAEAAVGFALKAGAKEADALLESGSQFRVDVLQGDIERWFEPITPAIGDGPSLQAILRFARDFYSQLAAQTQRWQIEVHQFRIEAKAGEPGEPTPEGVHRDGVDYVLVLLVDRQNIASGTTTIHDAGGKLLGSFTLTRPLDTALVDDARVFHGVTPVTPLDPATASHRDVLVVTLRGTG